MSPFRASAAITEEWKNFDFALDDGVATVTFSRPDKLNALTFDVYADLCDLLAVAAPRRRPCLSSPARAAGSARRGVAEEIIGELQGRRRRSCSGAHADERRRRQGDARDAPIPIIAGGQRGRVCRLLPCSRWPRTSDLAARQVLVLVHARGLAIADMGAALLPRPSGSPDAQRSS